MIKIKNKKKPPIKVAFLIILNIFWSINIIWTICNCAIF